MVLGITLLSISTDEINPVVEDVKGGGITYCGFRFHRCGVIKNGVTYYRCAKSRSIRCPATLNVYDDNSIKRNNKPHIHEPYTKSDSAFAGKKLIFKGHYFYKHGKCGNKIHWRCSKMTCPVRVHTDFTGSIMFVRGEHIHGVKKEKTNKGRGFSSFC